MFLTVNPSYLLKTVVVIVVNLKLSVADYFNSTSEQPSLELRNPQLDDQITPGCYFVRIRNKTIDNNSFFIPLPRSILSHRPFHLPHPATEHIPTLTMSGSSLNTSANGPSITSSYNKVINSAPASAGAASSPTYGQWALFTVQAPLVSAFQQDAGGKESVLKVQTTGGKIGNVQLV